MARLWLTTLRTSRPMPHASADATQLDVELSWVAAL